MLAGSRYALHAEAGVVAAQRDDSGLPGSALLQLEAALARGDAAGLRQAAATAVGPLRSQLRGPLHYHLGSPSPRTRQVMLDVQKLIDAEVPSR